MSNILKFPGQAPRLDHKRSTRRRVDPDQLDLFASIPGRVTDLPLNPFDEALLQEERGNYDQARDKYSEAIGAGESVPDAFCNLGIIEYRQGNRKLAIEAFAHALAQAPLHFNAHYNMGNMYLDAGEHSLARLHFELCAQSEPEFANAYYNLALACAMSGDFQPAINALKAYQTLANAEECTRAADLQLLLEQGLDQPRNRSPTKPGRRD
jgi:tetratricopeptide (TPR) repeat protein